MRFLENEPCEVLVARSERPHSVAAGGKELREVGAPSGEKEGWRFDPARRLLGIRFVPQGREVVVTIAFTLRQSSSSAKVLGK